MSANQKMDLIISMTKRTSVIWIPEAFILRLIELNVLEIKQFWHFPCQWNFVTRIHQNDGIHMTGYNIFKNKKAASILGCVYIDVKENMQVYLRHELMFENIDEIRVEIQKRDTKYVQVLALMQMHPTESLGRVIHESKVVWCSKCGILVLSVPFATVISLL